MGSIGWTRYRVITGTRLVLIRFPGKRGDRVEEFWRLFWTGLTIALVIGEVATAGFFMLPFAIGAGIAAVLAWLAVPVAVQWVAFLVTGSAAFVGLQRFARSDEVHPTGANRFDGATAVVIEAIDRTAGTGKVRMQAEEWRAVCDDEDLLAGTNVDIVEVRGTRLVVTPQDQSQNEGERE